MDRLQKIVLVTLLTSHATYFASDENCHRSLAEKRKREQMLALEIAQAKRSVVVWSGVAGFVGAVAGAAIGSWLASSDESAQSDDKVQNYRTDDSEVSFAYQDHVYVSPKEREVKAQLNALSKYGQTFDFVEKSNPTANEKTILLNLYKLGFQLHEIDYSFYDKIAQDYKILNDAGYTIWWYNLKSLESQKNCYLSNAKNLIAYFNRQQEFIHCYQIVNAYASLSLHREDLFSWIYEQNYNKVYPIIAYKKQLESDRKALVQFQHNSFMCQTDVMEKAVHTQSILDYVISLINGSIAYRQELDKKRYDELLQEANRLEQERLEIAKKQIQVQEQANKIAAEKNQIDRERNNPFYRK